MPRPLGVLTGAALGAAAIAAPAAAQEMDGLRTVRFGVQGGLAVPTGDDGDFLQNGVSIGGTLDWQLVNRPFGLRLDVGYQRFGLSDEMEEALDFFGIEADPASIVSGTGSIVLSIPTTGAVRPYVLGGAGVYHLRQSYEVPDSFGSCGFDDDAEFSRRPSPSRVAPVGALPSRSVAGRGAAAQLSCSLSETKAGLHAGAGLGFPLGGLDGYVEARFHSIFTDESNTNLVPIVFGLRF